MNIARQYFDSFRIRSVCTDPVSTTKVFVSFAAIMPVDGLRRCRIAPTESRHSRFRQLENKTYCKNYALRNISGNLAKSAAIRRASSLVSILAAAAWHERTLIYVNVIRLT